MLSQTVPPGSSTLSLLQKGWKEPKLPVPDGVPAGCLAKGWRQAAEGWSSLLQSLQQSRHLQNIKWVMIVQGHLLSRTNGCAAIKLAQKGAPPQGCPDAILADALGAAQAARLSYMPTTVLVILPYQLTPLYCCSVCHYNLKAFGAVTVHVTMSICCIRGDEEEGCP